MAVGQLVSYLFSCPMPYEVSVQVEEGAYQFWLHVKHHKKLFLK
jgi:hypothetical protein